MNRFIPVCTALERAMPMSRTNVETLLASLYRAPSTDGVTFTVNALDLRDAISIIEQVAAQMEPRS